MPFSRSSMKTFIQTGQYIPEQIFETFTWCSRTRDQDAVNACWKLLQVLLALHLLFCASRFDLSTSKLKVAAIFSPCGGFVRALADFLSQENMRESHEENGSTRREKNRVLQEPHTMGTHGNKIMAMLTQVPSQDGFRNKEARRITIKRRKADCRIKQVLSRVIGM